MHGKSTFAVVFFLEPHTLPGMIRQRPRLEPAFLPRIGAIALLVECERDDRTILIVPFTGQHTSIFGCIRRSRNRRQYGFFMLQNRCRAGGARQEHHRQYTDLPYTDLPISERHRASLTTDLPSGQVMWTLVHESRAMRRQASSRSTSVLA